MSRKKSSRDKDKMERKSKPTKVERDYDREEREDYDSDREDSATPSEEVMSSPCAQHNGTHNTHPEDDIMA